MSWKNKFGTKTFEEFTRKFLKSFGGTEPSLQFFNKTAIFDMGEKTAEIVLSTNGHSGHYAGFSIRITHKVNGAIAREWFGFKEYLMDGFETTQGNDYPSLVDHCGMD